MPVGDERADRRYPRFGTCWPRAGLGESICIEANSKLTHQGAELYRGDFASPLLTSLPYAMGDRRLDRREDGLERRAIPEPDIPHGSTG